MEAWFASLSSLETVYVLMAIAGGTVFALRLVLTIAGMGGHDVDDGGFDGGDVDHGGGDAGPHDTYEVMSFKLLSMQGLAGFAMMFGLVGMAVSRSYHSELFSLVGGTVAGLGLVWVTDKMFRFMSGLRDSGTIDLRNARGEEGTVYLGIPEGGTGKVRVTVQGRLRVLEAVSEDKGAIPTDTRVQVVGVVNENVMVVKRV